MQLLIGFIKKVLIALLNQSDESFCAHNDDYCNVFSEYLPGQTNGGPC